MLKRLIQTKKNDTEISVTGGFLTTPPVLAEKPSILDSFKPVIDHWLEEDKKYWRKQHIPPRGSMTVWWKNKAIQGAVASSSATYL